MPNPCRMIFALVGFAVAVGIAQEHQVRLLRDVDAAVAELEAGRNVEAVREHRRLVGASIAVGVLEDNQLVVGLLARQHVRIRRRRQHPQAALRVERHRERFGEDRGTRAPTRTGSPRIRPRPSAVRARPWDPARRDRPVRRHPVPAGPAARPRGQPAPESTATAARGARASMRSA